MFEANLNLYKNIHYYISIFELIMVAKNSSKQEALRIRVYQFFEKNKELGKIYTQNYFTAEKVPSRAVYRF